MAVAIVTMTDTTDNVLKGLVLRVGITATIFTVIGPWATRAWEANGPAPW